MDKLTSNGIAYITLTEHEKACEDLQRENERLRGMLKEAIDLAGTADFALGEDDYNRINELSVIANKHPLPVDGVCKCECNFTIREIYNGAKLQCTKCGGDVLANPIMNTDKK